MQLSISIFWFRRDLRLTDNASLYYALSQNENVLPIFIFDRNILNKLNTDDKRVLFIYQQIQNINQQLEEMGSSLMVFYCTPLEAFKTLKQTLAIKAVYTNHDYEGYAIKRDDEIKQYLQANGIAFNTYKDQVIFEKNEVVKDDGKPYTVFTPFSKKWKQNLQDYHLKSYPTEKYFNNFYKQKTQPIIRLHEMGFNVTNTNFPTTNLNEELVKKYSENRNFPALQGTSKLGIHLRFGTISIRQLAAKAQQLNETFLNELIWRDFYHSIVFHFPYINEGKAFKKEYDFIPWRNNEQEFDAWCKGKTGYQIVDAGMRELNATGFMHNRVRMIVASFLSKHLLIDWRWGEAYFAEKLLDYDFAANNGGWQWAAGCGCDAAPYFRVFNPTLQTEKFDKNLEYIHKWVPELNSFSYPASIVKHEDARKRCLEVYGKVLKKENL